MTRYIILILSVGLFSCKSFNGSIEKRDLGCDSTIVDSKKIFLVNKSSDKKFKFTIKATKTTNEKANDYSTEFLVLEPGEEIFLGCDGKKEFLSFPKKKIPVQIDSILDVNNKSAILCTYNDTILKYNFDWHFVYDNKEFTMTDLKEGALKSAMTISEYLRKGKILIEIPENSTDYDNSLEIYPKKTLWLNVDDLTKPQKINVYRYKFEITGQVEVRNRKSK